MTSMTNDPRKKYQTKDFPEQSQPYPGMQRDMLPIPDCGENSYVGHKRLSGKKALITGGDSGIGRAVAIAYAREGADVAIAYLPAEQADAEEVEKQITAAGRRSVQIPVDLTKEDETKLMVQTATDALGGLDIVVMVAGMQQAVTDINDISTKQLTDTFTTNVFSMFWTVQTALPNLHPGASIITTTSIQAYSPSPNLLDYASTKAAIHNFSQGLSRQLGDKGIRVNTVAPGPIWTALQVSGGQPTSALPSFGQQTSLGRAGQPAELAGTYVYLASDDASYVTGQCYGVTGGGLTN
ncbi:SDR family oxidoreductase [Furfurilactobacillus entadae]|uniref:SDR family oxidoreductase n=1 Tax=Furfurilactobacillus entadae TaxID=2922307 RepID=UPI0035EC5B26